MGFWEGGFQKVPRMPPPRVRPLRRAPSIPTTQKILLTCSNFQTWFESELHYSLQYIFSTELTYCCNHLSVKLNELQLCYITASNQLEFGLQYRYMTYLFQINCIVLKTEGISQRMIFAIVCCQAVFWFGSGFRGKVHQMWLNCSVLPESALQSLSQPSCYALIVFKAQLGEPFLGI